ncbi:DUF6707 family protein [Zhihengliuella flava]|uniref:Uncharacterized protein n=1 Tax=Zhihengliuella flava TaxID=1285193 RepID=A0A931DAZ9_9MICC|nr:DUF6707 family protein [Zhihengliuella flava]MBG6085152.1 hypothetical protein [Zhihengliuella flava]
MNSSEQPASAEVRIRTVRAEQVSVGDRFITRHGTPSAEVRSLRILPDSFGTPALVEATLASGHKATIACGSSIRVHTTAPAPLLSYEDLQALPVEPESPEAVLLSIAEGYPEEPAVLEPTARLARGVNLKAGAHLEALYDLAHRLVVDLDDRAGAWRLLDILTALEFDGNFGRWKSVESALALAAFLAYDGGDYDAADRYGQLVRQRDHVESDPLQAKLTAELRQRELDQPNLFDREVHRAVAGRDADAERQWRTQRLGTLLYLLAHGGSNTLDAAELRRRIHHELNALRPGRSGGPWQQSS